MRLVKTFLEDVSNTVLEKLASVKNTKGMEKIAKNRLMKYLSNMLSNANNTGGIAKTMRKMEGITDDLMSRGMLPKGKPIGKLPFRGEENTLRLWTGNMPSQKSTFKQRGVNPSLLVEKNPITPGMFTSPEKHKKTIEMMKGVADDKKLTEDFLPFSVSTARNPMEVAANPEYADRLFQPFIQNAGKLEGTYKKHPHLVTELFRRGQLDKVTPAGVSDRVVKNIPKTKVDPSRTHITDLKNDNFVFYNGKAQLADASPADLSNFIINNMVNKGTILNPGLFVDGTPYSRISQVMRSSALTSGTYGERINALKSLVGVSRWARMSPVMKAKLALTFLKTNTRGTQNIQYMLRNVNKRPNKNISSILRSIPGMAGKNKSYTGQVLNSFANKIFPEDMSILTAYLNRRTKPEILPEIPSGMLQQLMGNITK